MSRSKDMLIASLALTSLALGVVAWRQQMELRAIARRPAAETTAAQLPLPVTIRSATTQRFAVAPVQRGGGATLAAGDRTAVAATSAATSAGANSRPRRNGALMRLMESPEFVQALGWQRQAMLDTRFAGLFRRLNLEPAELARFKHLLAEKENVALDVVTVSENSPEGPLSAEALRASVRAAQAQVEQAIHSSLGGERYQIYREYERTLAQRTTVAQLEQRLSYTAAPLTPAQSEAMVRILVAHAPPAPVEAAPALSVVVRAGVPEAVPLLPTSAATGRVTEEVVAEAQTVLAPAQVAALREIQVEQHAAVRAAELVRGAMPVIEDTPALRLLLLQ